MKIIALEEHVLTPELLAAWAQVPTAKADGSIKPVTVRSVRH
jgi:hypothetical protein